MAIDDWHVGVRVSRPELGPVIESMFAGHLVDHADDPDVPPNWSVRIGGFGDEDDDGQRALQLLYRAKRQAARSRWPSDVLGALAAQMSALADRPLPGWRSRGVALIGPTGQAVLAVPALRSALPRLQPQLEARGIGIAAATDPRVDLTTAEVVVPEPLFTLSEAGADDLDARFGPASGGQRPPEVHPGRYSLAGWALLGQDGRSSSAATIATLAETFAPVGSADDGQRLLEALKDESTHVERSVLGLRTDNHSANVDALCQLLG